jgi:hypothetical protein
MAKMDNKPKKIRKKDQKPAVELTKTMALYLIL